jgi:hydroxyacyl-ACP dehydratase HTD2-like protein with hotdog domain
MTIGDTIPTMRWEPTQAQLFAFSAATWNTHRIHYDSSYARAIERHPDVVVQSHLHACALCQAVKRWQPEARLERLGWQNRGIAIPGDRLTVSGRVTGVESVADALHVSVALEERNQREELCVTGWATVAVREGVGP